MNAALWPKRELPVVSSMYCASAYKYRHRAANRLGKVRGSTGPRFVSHLAEYKEPAQQRSASRLPCRQPSRYPAYAHSVDANLHQYVSKASYHNRGEVQCATLLIHCPMNQLLHITLASAPAAG